MNDLYLAHHGIKGQKWGVRRFQNEDGSLTKAGHKRFDKLIQLDKEHKKHVKESTEAANKEHAYLSKSRFGRWAKSDYKEAARNLYIEDKKFKEIADKATDAWKKSRDSADLYIHELSKVSRSNYNLFTVIGHDRAEQILRDYGQYEMKHLGKK